MPPSYAQQAANFRINQLPGAFPMGKLFDQPNGGSNSIWANIFRNQVKNGDPGYTREDSQMVTGAEAYFGQTEVISQTITVMTLTDMNWLTKVISPWRLMDETTKSFTWNSTKFKPAMATEVPHLGIVRLVRSERTSAKVAIKRWGIGYAMEHDFMNTREGLRYHLAHLQQMSNAILEAVKHDILFTLLDAYSFERRFIKEKKLYKGWDADRYFREQAWMFASLQKEKHAIEKLDSEINERMYKWRGVANTWIMPPQIIRYLSQVPPENTTYSEAGPAGPQRLLDGPTPWGVLAKQPVYIARAFYTDQLSANNSLLEDTVEFGEYYRMSNPAFDPDCAYRSRHRNLMLFNFPTDSFVEFGLRTALDNCYLFKEDGHPLYLDDTHSLMQYSARIGNEHDRQRDYFTYCSQLSDGKYQYNNAMLMGELELHYWTVEDKIHQAISGMDAIASKMGHNVFNKVMQDLTNGKALVQQIANLPFDPADEQIIQDTYGTQLGASPRGITNIHSILQSQEIRQNAVTGFAQRVPNARPLPKLLPGYQTFGGLVELSQIGPAAEKQIAADTVQAIRLLVGYIKDMYPGSILTNPAYASPVEWFPTAESAFFNNFLHKGNNPPLFLASGGKPIRGDRTLSNLVQNSINAWNGQLPAALQIKSAAPDDASRGQLLSFYLRAAIIFAVELGPTAVVPPSLLNAIQTELQLNAGGALATGWSADNEVDARNKAIESLLRLAGKNKEYNRFDTFEEASRYIAEIETTYDFLRGSAGKNVVDFSKFARSPFVASSTYMATYYNALKSGTPPEKTLIGDPLFPEIPASESRLDQLTSNYPQRSDLSGPERQAVYESGNVSSNLVDTVPFSNTLPLGNNALFMNVMSASVGMNLGSDSSPSSIGGQMSVGLVNRGDAPPIDMSKGIVKGMRRKTTQAAEILSRDLELTREQRRLRGNTTLSDPMKRLMEYGERMLSSNFVKSWKGIEEQAQNPLVLALAHIYDGMLIHKKVFTSFIENNIRIPLDFFITRPHISLRQLTAIKLQAGGETMFTAVAPGQFELADDAAVQGHIGTLTSKHKAVCTNPENVYINKGIFINGVNGGLGLNCINPTQYNCGRGNFAGQDIIVVPVAPHDTIDGSLFSLTGDLSVAELEGLGLTNSPFLQFETTARINKLFGFREVRNGISYSETAVDSVPRNVFSNVLCMPGTHIQCNPRENKFNIVVQGQSMLQGLIYPGCAAVLCGKMTEVNRNPWTAFLTY